MIFWVQCGLVAEVDGFNVFFVGVKVMFIWYINYVSVNVLEVCIEVSVGDESYCVVYKLVFFFVSVFL